MVVYWVGDRELKATNEQRLLQEEAEPLHESKHVAFEGAEHVGLEESEKGGIIEEVPGKQRVRQQSWRNHLRDKLSYFDCEEGDLALPEAISKATKRDVKEAVHMFRGSNALY